MRAELIFFLLVLLGTIGQIDFIPRITSLKMGLMTEGTALTWEEIVAVRDLFRSHALTQLIRVYEKCKGRKGDCFMWGDELELTLVRFDHANKRVQLLLKGHKLLPRLIELNESINDGTCRIAWHPEACDYVVEGVPAEPYGYVPSYLNTVEANMALRREQTQKLLSEESDCEYILNISAFPLYGHGQFTYPPQAEGQEKFLENSSCYPPEIISPGHPRVKAMSENIVNRRLSSIYIPVPIFRDSATASPFRDATMASKTEIIDDHVHLEGFLAGWGCCCLQVTFQAQSLTGALRLHDQLLPLTGIMLALSSACPIWRGYLTDIDCRYNILSQAADDRTPDERQRPTLNSRCFCTPLYVSDEHDHLNDVKVEFDEKVVSTLISEGMPSALARHFGHLFIRDPLVILKEHLHPTDETSSYHFENLNSMIWYSLRLKPPPLDDDQMGWRVEFRPMDIQITDFENASLSVFLALITRVIFTYGLDLTIPISHINENINRAHRRDSVRTEKFYFRLGEESCQMTINEIMNGSERFSGLIALVYQYLHENEEINVDTKQTVKHYLSLISKRAAGVLLTDASWMRQFVTSHADYKQDSVISDQIQHDLLWKIAQISNGHESCPSLIQPRMHTNTHLQPD